MIFGEQNNPYPSPRSPFIHSKLSCMSFSTGSNSGKTFCGEGEGKRHFPLFRSETRQKGSLGSVSTNFDANCGLIEPATDEWIRNAQDQLGKKLTEDPVCKPCVKHSIVSSVCPTFTCHNSRFFSTMTVFKARTPTFHGNRLKYFPEILLSFSGQRTKVMPAL